MSNPDQTLVSPTVGRIVHYTLSTGEVRPAIVVRCWDGHGGYPPGVVNLQVFLDGRNDGEHAPVHKSPFGMVQSDECDRGLAWRTSVHPSKTGESDHGCWHWPPRS